MRRGFRNFFPLLVLTGVALTSSPLFAQERLPSFSADEFFDQALDDLKDSMREAGESNVALSTKNRVLQKEMAALEQQTANLEKKRLLLLQDSLQVGDAMNLDIKEKLFSQRRAENLSSRKTRLLGQQKSLREKIRRRQESGFAVQENVEKLKLSLQEIQTRFAESRKNFPQKTRSQERQNLDQQLQAKPIQLKTRHEKIARLRKRVAELTPAHDALQNSKTALSQQANAVDEDFKIVLGESQWLDQELRDLGREATKGDFQISRDIAQLKSWREKLKESLAELKGAGEAILRPSQGQERQLQDFINRLEKDRQLCRRQSQALEQRLFLFTVGRPAGQAVSQNAIAALMEQRDRVRKDGKDLKALIAEKQKPRKKQPSRAREAAVEKKQPLPDARNFALEKKTLSREIIGVEKKAGRARAELSTLQRSFRDKMNMMNQLNAKREILNWQWAEFSPEFEKLNEESKVVEVEAGNLVAAAEANRENLKEEIIGLKSRQALLSGSLEAITAKYDEKDFNASGISPEEDAQLTEYLAILQRENTSLQEKMLGLLVLSDKLKSSSP